MYLNFVGLYQIQLKSYEQNKFSNWNYGQKSTTSHFCSFKLHNYDHTKKKDQMKDQKMMMQSYQILLVQFQKLSPLLLPKPNQQQMM